MKKIILATLLALAAFALQAQGQVQTFKGGGFVLNEDYTTEAHRHDYEFSAGDSIALEPGFYRKSRFPQTINHMINSYEYKTMSLDLDPQGVYPPEAGETGGSFGGVVGTLGGTVDVGSMGGLLYSIPLEVPAGINGMQPSLAVTFNSQGGNGLLGWCWDLAGLSAITRTGKTLYHDGMISGADLDDDRFLLDGQRLIAVRGKYGESGSQYKTENDGFSNISYVLGDIGGTFAYYFQVRNKEGYVINYGATRDSRLLASDGYTCIMWQVSSISDREGNTILYEYSTDNGTGESYIKKITYTLNGAHGVKTPQFSLNFQYNRKDGEENYERTDYDFAYIANNMLMNKRLLYRIIVKNENKSENLYKYEFNYEVFSYEHQYNRLGRINKMMALKDTWQEQCATEINWSTSEPNNTTKVETNLGNELSKKFPFVGDFNGDGYSDIVLVPYKGDGYIDNPTISVYLNEGNGQFSQQPYFTMTTEKTLDWVYVFDANGDGLDDLMPFYFEKYEDNTYKSKMTLYRNDRPNNTFIESKSAETKTRADVCIGDFDGNGTDDALLISKSMDHIHSNDTIYSYSAVRYIRYLDGVGINTELLIGNLSSLGGVHSSLSADFNGDGKSEILLVGFKGENNSKIIEIDMESNNGIFNEIYAFDSNNSNLCCDFDLQNWWCTVFSGDFNGDGKVDLLSWKNTYWSMYFSTGTEFRGYSIDDNEIQMNPNYQYLYYPSLSMVQNQDAYQVRICVADFDGDGCSDILRTTGGKYITILSRFDIHPHYSGGYHGCLFRKKNAIKMPFEFHSQYIHTGNFTGQEHSTFLSMLKPDDNIGRYKPYIAGINPIRKYNMVESITDNLGNTVKFSYEYLRPYNNDGFYDFAFRGDDANGIRTKALCMQALRSYSMLNVYGAEIKTEYAYSNALHHKTGRGFIGFESVTSATYVDNVLKSRTVCQYETSTMGSNAMTLPKLEKTTVPMANGQGERTAEIQSFEFDKVNCSRDARGLVACPAMTKKTVQKFDIDSNQSLSKLLSETLTEYHYDYNHSQYSYPDSYACTTTTEEVKGYDENNLSHQESFLTKKSSFTSNTTSWVLNRKDNETIIISRPGKPEVASYTEFHYESDDDFKVSYMLAVPNGGGNLNDPLAVKTEFGYDGFGNLTKKVTTANNPTFGEGVHINTYEYGENYQHRLLTKETVGPEADGYATTYTYDNFDRLQSATDCNGQTIGYETSLLGTSQTTTAIDGTKLKQVSRWVNRTKYAPSGASYYTWSKQTGGIPTLVFYHKTGVELRTVTFNFKNKPIFVDKHYDAQGRLQEVSLPYGKDEEPQWTSYKYDIYDRPTIVTLPDHSETRTDYNGFFTKSTFYPDAEGHPDDKQETRQKVNALGWVTESTDDEGTTVHYDYFADGKLEWTQIGEDGGTRISLQYDQARNRTELTDPNYGKTSSVYNAFGEEISRTNPKEQTTTFTYDDYGRMTDRMDGGENINTHWNYFGGTVHKGLLESITYGDQDISYTYDDLQRLVSTTDRGYTTSFTYDFASRIASVTYPSGFTMNSLYKTTGHLYGYTDADGNMLWQTDDVSPRGELLQSTMGGSIVTNRSFHPEKHILTGVTTVAGENNLQNLTFGYDDFNNLEARIDNLRNLNESFTYDNLNRLTDIELNGVQTGMMTYDDYGRMTSKTMDGQLVFQGASFEGPEGKPHAIKSAQTNDGVFPADVQKITYTSFDKVKHIAEGDNRLSYTYGYNRQRIGMEETVGGKQRNKTYVGNCEYIKETADGVTTEKVLTYLSGPTGVFAVVEKQGEEESLHYILKDHLGSWTTITDAEGNVEQELSFDAWGNLRDPETWHSFSQAEPVEAPMFDRGYTGHEHITAFGLINMNGRCYDPLMSSFLSVDEYVQDPSNAQNFNRYAYCLNNPLKYTDPSGWMARGLSHSEASEYNRYRLYMNACLSEEQWANTGINRMILAKIKLGTFLDMTPFMMGEEQKGGGGGIVIKGNDGINTAYSPGMEYKGNDQFTKDAVNSLNEIYSQGGDFGKQMISTLVQSGYTYYITDLAEGGSKFKEEDTRCAYFDQKLEELDPSQTSEWLNKVKIGCGGTIYWNRGQLYRSGEEMILNSTLVLSHELVHAWDACWGVLQDDPTDLSDLNYREWSACYWSNRIAQDMSIPIMTHYPGGSEETKGSYNPLTKEFSGIWYRVVDSYNNPIYKSRY